MVIDDILMTACDVEATTLNGIPVVGWHGSAVGFGLQVGVRLHIIAPE
jgi:hypothetical protein